MNKRLAKTGDNKVIVISSLGDPANCLLPGWELLPEQEVLDVDPGLLSFDEAGSVSLDLSKVRMSKLAEIRKRRDAMLLVNDKEWLIAAKKGESTTAIESDAEILRDLPELAETELNALETLEDVEAYDCFTGLVLSRSYE